MNTRTLPFVLSALVAAAAGCEDPDRIQSMTRNLEGGASVGYGHYTDSSLNETGGQWVGYQIDVGPDGQVLESATRVASCADVPAAAGPCVDASGAGPWQLADGSTLSVGSEPVTVARADASGAALWSLAVTPLRSLSQSPGQPIFGDALYLLGPDADSDDYKLVRVDLATGALSWIFHLDAAR